MIRVGELNEMHGLLANMLIYNIPISDIIIFNTVSLCINRLVLFIAYIS